MYLTALDGMNQQGLISAVQKLILTNKYFPTIAELADAAGLISDADAEAAVAWDTVLTFFANHGTDRHDLVIATGRTQPDCKECGGSGFMEFKDADGNPLPSRTVTRCECRSMKRRKAPALSERIEWTLKQLGGLERLDAVEHKYRGKLRSEFVDTYKLYAKAITIVSRKELADAPAQPRLGQDSESDRRTLAAGGKD